jgi:polyhydroxyalkanoate synthase
MHEFNELTQKLVKGGEFFRHLREEDIQIGVTPKEEVYREDKWCCTALCQRWSVR